MTTAPSSSGSRLQAPPPGLTVAGYAMRARLGEGGMGVVHLAQRPGERPVALKVLRPHIVGDDEARRRLAREVNSLARIRSRRVAEIVDADPWGDIPYVATRYVPGLTLHDHIHEEGPLAESDLLWFADCLAEALEAVHHVGVLHRDIKPSNVIMEGRTPILIDFGLARVADDPRITHTGWLLGTPGYLAPEILMGEDATTASDVHSWAATVAFAGLGEAPFGRGPSVAVMDRVRRGEHDLATVPRRLVPLLREALDPDQRNRPTLPETREWLAALSDSPHAPAPRVDRHDFAPEPVTAPYAVAPTPTRVMGEGGRTTVLPGQPAPYVHPPAPVPVGLGERLLRGLQVAAGAVVIAAGAAAAPYVTLGVLSILAWLLRSGSRAASAAGDRRQLRGMKWYDSLQMVFSTPWHVVAALPGTLLLIGWSLGIAVAALLLCFAAAAGSLPTLAAMGLVFGLSMWWGPGSTRVRSAVQVASHPLARNPVASLLVTLVLLAGAAGLWAAAADAGTQWAPAQDRPFADVRLPSWL